MMIVVVTTRMTRMMIMTWASPFLFWMVLMMQIPMMTTT